MKKLSKRCATAVGEVRRDIGAAMKKYKSENIVDLFDAVNESASQLTYCPCKLPNFYKDLNLAFREMDQGRQSMMVAYLGKAKASMREDLKKCKEES